MLYVRSNAIPLRTGNIYFGSNFFPVRIFALGIYVEIITVYNTRNFDDVTLPTSTYEKCRVCDFVTCDTRLVARNIIVVTWFY